MAYVSPALPLVYLLAERRSEDQFKMRAVVCSLPQGRRELRSYRSVTGRVEVKVEARKREMQRRLTTAHEPFQFVGLVSDRRADPPLGQEGRLLSDHAERQSLGNGKSVRCPSRRESVLSFKSKLRRRFEILIPALGPIDKLDSVGAS